MLEHRPLLELPKTHDIDGINSARQAPEINLIPLIDVLLVILIFLMISTTFTQYQELAITLPSVTGDKSSSTPKEMRVAVSRDGKFALNGQLIEGSALAQQLRTMHNSHLALYASDALPLRLVVAADAKAAHQAVMQVLEMAGQAGILNIVFATQESQTPPKTK